MPKLFFLRHFISKLKFLKRLRLAQIVVENIFSPVVFSMTTISNPNSTPSTDLCRLSFETTATGPILTVMSTVVILDIISIFLLSIYLYCYLTNGALHLNLRALIASITVALIIRNCLTCYRACRMIITAIFAVKDPCILLTPKTLCTIESVINACPILCVFWGFTIVTVERIIATIFYKTYEKTKLYFLAIVCGILPWLIFGYQTTESISSAVRSSTVLMPYCSSLSSQAFNLFEMMSYQVPLALVTSLIALANYAINKRAKQFESTSGGAHLTTRYQRLENIEASKTIAVNAIAFLIFYIGNVYALILISQLNITDLPTFALAKELSSLTFPIHGNVHVISSLFLSQKTRQRFFATKIIRKISVMFCCKKKLFARVLPIENTINPEAEQAIYFRNYEQQWK